MEFFNNHRKLFSTAIGLFVLLTILVAIVPAVRNQNNNAPLPNAPELSPDAMAGKALYVANGCVACHTQQVRNVDMDNVWGDRPGISADYAANERMDIWRNTATLMGTERTGPDLTNIGVRQPSIDWHLVHLFNPRIVVKESIMPAYPWMFEIVDSAKKGDVVVNVPKEYLKGRTGKLIAKPAALQLVAYLQSLRQTKLPDGLPAAAFLYKRAQKKAEGSTSENELDGAALYTANCQTCHQANGEGLAGAFPGLKGSSIVLDDNPELMVDIIMNGYSARKDEGFAVMPPVGTLANLSAEEITAIMNHEKTSWGNDAKKVTVDQIKKIMEVVKLKTPQE